jgi:hypothetical protein
VVQINYEVDDDLHQRVRLAVARQRVDSEGRRMTIKQFVIDALTEAVERVEAEGESESTKRKRKS